MSKIIRYNKLVVDKIKYKKPIQQNNLYFGSINYEDDQCLIQSPKLIFKEITEDLSTKQKYLVVSVDPNDFSFYDLLVKLDDHNLSQTYKSSKEWFNKDLPMDVLENMYRRISSPFSKDTIPEIKIKVPFHKDKIQTKVYDQSNTIIDYEQLKEGCQIICILHIKGLKFLKKDYYCDNSVTQIKLCSLPVYNINDKCLIEDDENNHNINESKYDYEILDEEIIEKENKKMEYQKLIKNHEENIKNHEENIKKEQTELSTIQEKLKELSRS
jgi:hypothetical protein